MSNIKTSLSKNDIHFIKNQKMFFVATSPKKGKINISPKGLDDTFKIISHHKLLWLNYFGSGNETAAHLLENKRMTIMFCSFNGKPNILRLYCKVKTIQKKNKLWNKKIKLFNFTRGARQIFDVKIQFVNNSCGMGVPLYDFVKQRESLINYYKSNSKKKHLRYMKKNNQISFDGKPTKLF